MVRESIRIFCICAASFWVGCTKNLIEKDEGKRSVLVEKGVYEYHLGTEFSGPGSGVYTIPIDGFTPRHRISEDWEWVNVPLPVFRYRFLNKPSCELAADFGSFFVPFLFAGIQQNNGSHAVLYLPDNILAGLHGIYRMPYAYLKLIHKSAFLFSDHSGYLTNTELRFGLPMPGFFSLEAGIKSQGTHTDDIASKQELAGTLNLHVNGMKIVNGTNGFRKSKNTPA